MRMRFWVGSDLVGSTVHDASGNAANKCEKQGLRKEDRGDREIARAERFHQADFDAALKDGSGHRSRNSEG